MKKNYNYAYVNRTSRPKPHIDFTNMERADCTASVLKSSPVTNDRLWHTTDTNEFYFDWNGKRSKLNVTGDNAAMAAEIAKIKADMANLNPDEVGKKIKTLETKVNTAAKNAQNAQTSAQTAAQAAQTAASQVSKKADKTYVDNNFAKKTDIPSLTGYATQQWVENKNYLTEHQSLEGYAKISDIPEIPTIPEVPTNVSAFTNDAGYLTEHQDISGKADKTDLNGLASQEWVSEQGYLTAQNISGKADITYVDETFAAKDDIPEVPENVSAFNNDAGYLTEVEVGTFPTGEDIEEPTTDANGYAKVQDIMNYVNALIEKKKDELAPGGDTTPYLYTNGYKRGETATELSDPLSAYEIVLDGNDEFVIELLHKDETDGWYDVDDPVNASFYGEYFKVILPNGYEVKTYLWDPNIGDYKANDTLTTDPAFALVADDSTPDNTTYYYKDAVDNFLFGGAKEVESVISQTYNGHLIKVVVKKNN